MKLKTGNEPFRHQGDSLDVRLLDFWRWAGSNILSNALRGQLAEFIVAHALGVADAPRLEWDACDLRLSDGTRVEVKSAAYWQSWPQTAPSRINFNISTRHGWNAETNETASEAARNADVFVFCLLAERDREKVDPLILEQWDFYVVPTAVLERELGAQKAVGLKRLGEIVGGPASYDALARTIESATRASSEKAPSSPHSKRSPAR